MKLPQNLNKALTPIFVTVLGGCAADGGIVIGPGDGYPAPRAEHIRIPKGHMPPPGQCRIWYPDRPPGQQPPPGDCHDLRYRVPPGATLVRG